MFQTSVTIVKAQVKDHDGCVACIVTECKSKDKLVVKSAATYSRGAAPLTPNNLSDIDKKCYTRLTNKALVLYGSMTRRYVHIDITGFPIIVAGVSSEEPNHEYPYYDEYINLGQDECIVIISNDNIESARGRVLSLECTSSVSITKASICEKDGIIKCLVYKCESKDKSAVRAAKKGVSLENNTLVNIDSDFAMRLAISALQLRASMERRYVVINISEFPIIDAYVSRNLPEDNKNLMTAYNKLKEDECLVTFINKKTESCATRLIKLGA